MTIGVYTTPQGVFCRDRAYNRNVDRKDISSRRRMRIQDETDHDPAPRPEQESESKPEQTIEHDSAAMPEHGLKACQLEHLFPPCATGYETYEAEESSEPSVSSF
jgi:hypothetical protein